MKLDIPLRLLMFGLFFIPGPSYAQELEEINVEKSAEVFLEEYSDTFQEKFFEALKQKGIENHDRAIYLFLECKQLQPQNHVVDHELALAYFADKKFIEAEGYALDALTAEPSNFWYLNTLIKITQKQGNSQDILESRSQLQHPKLKENLALIYYRQENYESALDVLEGMPKSNFSETLSAKVNDSIKKKRSVKEKTTQEVAKTIVSDPLLQYKTSIESFIAAENLEPLQQLAEEALDSYPTQPYFYYAIGYVLNKKGKHKEAVAELEAALDLILDDVPLANKLYEELVRAYTALNNTSKANMYLRRIKPGF